MAKTNRENVLFPYFIRSHFAKHLKLIGIAFRIKPDGIQRMRALTSSGFLMKNMAIS